jgi:hypothetical protein
VLEGLSALSVPFPDKNWKDPVSKMGSVDRLSKRKQVGRDSRTSGCFEFGDDRILSLIRERMQMFDSFADLAGKVAGTG